MERDEAGTLERLKANRQAIFDPRVAAHGGRIVKLMGDGALVEFAQRRLRGQLRARDPARDAKPQPARREAERIRYRIGINLGEVIVEGDDIYGDGVNVAARLQALAEPGGIALSRTVRDQVAGKVAADVRRSRRAHGQEHRAARPRVRAARATIARKPRGARVAAAPQRLSICVLPFANMSGDPEQEYFSDGITEDIITDLSQGVGARRSCRATRAFTFKGKHIDIAQVARAAQGDARARRQRAQVGQSRAHHRAADRRRDRQPPVGRALRPRPERHLRAAGRDLRSDRQRAEAQAAAGREEGDRAALDDQSGGVQALPDGAAVQRDGQFAPPRHRDPAVASARSRSIPTTRARGRCSRSARRTSGWSNVGTGDTGWDAAERALALQPDLAEAHAAKGRILGDAGPLRRGAGRASRPRCALDPDRLRSERARPRAATSRCGATTTPIACLEKAAAAIETDFWALGMAIQCYEAMGDVDGVEVGGAARASSGSRRSSSPSPTTASRSAGA